MSNINPTMSNSEADRQAVLSDAREMGKREGSGSAARANLYNTCVLWAKERRIDVADSATMWDEFDKGAAAGAAMVGGNKVDKNATDTRKVRVSEVRQFIKMGVNPYIDGCEVMDRALVIIKRARQDGRLTSKPTDAMLNVARAQNKDAQNPLEDETIESVIFPASSEETKTEVDKLIRVVVELDRIMKRYEVSDHIESAKACALQRIADLGGSMPAPKPKKAK